MRWLILIFFITSCGYGRYIKRLDDQEYDHWTALKVFMDQTQRKTYLKLKTRPERDEYLKKVGLWDRFYVYDENIRDLIVERKVQTGWNTDMLQMAWGRPIDKRNEFRSSAIRSEKWIYKFEKHPDGSVLVWVPGSKTEYKAELLFKRHVIIEDGGRLDKSTDDLIVEIIDK